ncbi:MAG: hypothetical protein KBF87_08235 [Flavobacteriales bacterium]|nr:hypothetical protein [Flavobacteriales bacterium]
MRILLLLVVLCSSSKFHAQRVIHIVVALCDNQYQGIVKVPAGIGNGQDARTNLYWGAGYGVKTHFNRSAEWTAQPSSPATNSHILERAVWKHRDSAVYIIADAYDGRYIKEATQALFSYASGAEKSEFVVNGVKLNIGGGADLIAYVGHDGLMEFSLDRTFTAKDTKQRETIILACISKRYFAPYLEPTGAKPLVWTTGLMAPEAYTLKAALIGWVAHESDADIRERAAKAYDQYQKCGINGARRLLVTGW